MKSAQSVELPGEAIERFWQKVERGPGCWLWTGAKGKAGYGSFGVHGKTRHAHRLAWELANGPIPTGLCVCHRCDVRDCVNPDHLWLGTSAENIADMIAKGRQARGERSAGAKLRAGDVRLIRSSAEPQKNLARRFGVTRQAIGLVLRRARWAHVLDEPAQLSFEYGQPNIMSPEPT